MKRGIRGGEPFDQGLGGEVFAGVEDDADLDPVLAVLGRHADSGHGRMAEWPSRTVLALALSAVHSGPIQGAASFAPFRM